MKIKNNKKLENFLKDPKNYHKFLSNRLRKTKKIIQNNIDVFKRLAQK